MVRMMKRLAGVAAVGLLVLTLAGCGTNAVLDAMKAVRILDTNSAGAEYAAGDIAVSGSSVYAAYYEPVNRDLKFSSSADGGDTWGTPTMVDSVGDVGSFVKMSLFGATLDLNYLDATNSNPKYSFSTDGGGGWTSHGATRPAGAFKILQVITVSGGATMYCYYQTNTNLLQFSSSFNQGSSWTAGVTIGPLNPGFTLNDYSSQILNVVFESDTIFGVFWADGNASPTNGLRFSRTADQGVTWSAPRVLSFSGQVPRAVSVAHQNNSYFVTYYCSSTANVYSIKSVDGGTNWSTSTQIKTLRPQTTNNRWLALQALSTKLDLVFFDMDGLQVASSTDAGATWTISSALNTYGSWGFVNATGDSDTVYVLFTNTDNRGSKNLAVIRSNDDGASWF